MKTPKVLLIIANLVVAENSSAMETIPSCELFPNTTNSAINSNELITPTKVSTFSENLTKSIQLSTATNTTEKKTTDLASSKISINDSSSDILQWRKNPRKEQKEHERREKEKKYKAEELTLTKPFFFNSKLEKNETSSHYCCQNDNVQKVQCDGLPNHREIFNSSISNQSQKISPRLGFFPYHSNINLPTKKEAEKIRAFLKRQGHCVTDISEIVRGAMSNNFTELNNKVHHYNKGFPLGDKNNALVYCWDGFEQYHQYSDNPSILKTLCSMLNKCGFVMFLGQYYQFNQSRYLTYYFADFTEGRTGKLTNNASNNVSNNVSKCAVVDQLTDPNNAIFPICGFLMRYGEQMIDMSYEVDSLKDKEYLLGSHVATVYDHALDLLTSRQYLYEKWNGFSIFEKNPTNLDVIGSVFSQLQNAGFVVFVGRTINSPDIRLKEYCFTLSDALIQKYVSAKLQKLTRCNIEISNTGVNHNVSDIEKESKYSNASTIKEDNSNLKENNK